MPPRATSTNAGQPGKLVCRAVDIHRMVYYIGIPDGRSIPLLLRLTLPEGESCNSRFAGEELLPATQIKPNGP